MKTRTDFAKTSPATALALLLAALAIETTSPLARAAAPVALSLKGAWPEHGHPRGEAVNVAVQVRYAYGPTTTGFLTLDVSVPENPLPVGSYREEIQWGCCDGANDMTVSGSHAYVADAYAGLEVIDVSNPANPVGVGGYDTGAC